MTRSPADEQLLSMPLESLEALLNELLWLQSAGNLAELALSALANSSLVQDCLLPGMLETLETRGRAVQAFLHWLIDTQRPGGENILTEKRWREYNSLFCLHFASQGWTEESLAEKMEITRNGLSGVRKRAIRSVAQRLSVELKAPDAASKSTRKIYGIEHFYEAQAPDEQRIIRLLAVFQHAVALPVLQRLAKELGINCNRIPSKELWSSGFILQEPDLQAIKIQPEAQRYLLRYISLEERVAFHQAAATHHFQHNEYLEVFHHCRQIREAGGYEEVAAFLIEHHRSFVTKYQADELFKLLAEFAWDEEHTDTWARLKVTAGDAILLANKLNIEAAIEQYRLVLVKEEKISLHHRALAYYRIARAFESRNFLEESFRNYNEGIKLLSEKSVHKALLAAMHIDRAWIFLQSKKNLKEAQKDVKKAEALGPEENSEHQVRLYTIKCKLAWYGDDQKTQFETGLKAWLVALATEDNHLKIMAANNLGETYTWAGEFDKGLEYLKKAYDLAKLIDDQHNLAKVSKTIGASYFFRGYFDAAIIHYKSAYAILKEGKDLDWLGDLSHDLAEAHVELGLQEETKNYHELFECGRQYYAEGMKIATDMFVDVLFANLTALNEKYYGIFHRLPKKEQPGFEQQLRARRYVEKHGQITPKRYCEINNVSRAAATRHLKEVENKGIIEQKGRGGAIYYVLKTEPDLDGYLDFVI